MDNDIIISVVGGLMTLFIAVTSIALPIVFNRLFKSIDGVRADLTKSIGDVRADLTKSIGDVRADLTKSINDVRADLTKSIDEVRADLTKSIDEVRTDLKAHEKECRMRDRDLVAKVNWIMGKLGTQVPEPPKPEETEPA